MKLQVIWSWEEPGFWFVRFDRTKTDLALIYRWALQVGFLEVRSWR